MYNGILFDISDFWHIPDTLDDGVSETTGVAFDGGCCGLGWINGTFNKEGVFLVSSLEEVEMIIHGGGVWVVLQHNDRRIFEDLIQASSLEGMEGGERKRQSLL